MTSTDAKPEVAERRNKRTRARRLNLMLLLVLATATFGVFTVTMAWYDTYLPPTQVMNSSFNRVEGITASGSVTGWDLTHQEAPQGMEVMGQATLPPPRPSSVLGLPQPVFFLVALALFAAVGAVVKIGFVTGIGVVCGFFAWKQLGALRGILENPNFGGAYNHPAQGLMWFQLSLLLAVGLCVAVTIQVVMTNSETRRKEKEEAKRNGDPVTPSFLEVLWANTIIGPLARHGNMSSGATKSTEEAASGHLPKEKANA